MDKRGVVVPLCVSGHRHFLVARRGLFGERGYYIGETLVFALPACRQDQLVPFHFDVHRRIAQRKEAVSWSHAREPRLFSVLHPTKERFHTSIEPKIHLL